MLAKKNKELNSMMESMAKENKVLKDQVASTDQGTEQSTSINKDLKEELKEKDRVFLMLLGGL